ncbi:MAG: chitobiase/beta-hexosaminidase C-terminal domain-containing protein [Acidobacteriota bacterium]|nr:chitobiase/beta-hexosaminidase C-terminal domain-containing protein [Acidobacteriota bacterium]
MGVFGLKLKRLLAALLMMTAPFIVPSVIAQQAVVQVLAAGESSQAGLYAEAAYQLAKQYNGKAYHYTVDKSSSCLLSPVPSLVNSSDTTYVATSVSCAYLYDQRQTSDSSIENQAGPIWIVWNDSGQVWAYLSVDSTVAVRGFLASPRAQIKLWGDTNTPPDPQNLVNVWDDGSADTALPQKFMNVINKTASMTAAVSMMRPEDALFATQRELAATSTAFPASGTKLLYGLGWSNPGNPGTALPVDPYTGYPIQSDYSLALEQAVLFNLTGLDPITSQSVGSWVAIPYGASPLVVVVNRGDPNSLGYIAYGGSSYGITNLTLYDNTVTDSSSPSSGCTSCLPAGDTLPSPQRYPAAWLFSGNECDTGVFQGGPANPSATTNPVNPVLANPLSGAWNVAEYSMFDTANFPNGMVTIYPGGVQDNGTANPLGLTQENYVAARMYGVSRNNPLNKWCVSVLDKATSTAETAGYANRSRVVGMADTIAALTNTSSTGTILNQELGQAVLPVQDEIGYVLFSYELFGSVDPNNTSYTVATSPNANASNLPEYGYLSIRWVDSDGTVHDVDPLYNSYSGQLPTCNMAGTANTVTCKAPSADGKYTSYPNLRNGTYPLWTIYRMVTDSTSSGYSKVTTLMNMVESIADTTLPDIVPFDPQCAATQDGINDEPGLSVYREHYVAPYNPTVSVTANNGPQLAAVQCSSYTLPHLALGGSDGTTSESGNDIGGLIRVSGQVAAASPTFSLASARYLVAQTVTLSDTTTNASIHYTTDGSTPTTSSTLYTGSITVSTTETINAVAIAPGYVVSAVASATYEIGNPLAPTPVFSPASGTTFTDTLSITISDTASGATIYYTTDGSTPTTSSTVYDSAITISAATTLNAIATADGYSTSVVAKAQYTIQAADPVFSPAAGTYTGTQQVSITDTTANVYIYYTRTGDLTPTLYSGPITVDSTTALTAYATGGSGTGTNNGINKSNTVTASYTISGTQADTPVLSLAAGTYNSVQSVTISDTTTGAKIYYTLDGSWPTSASTLFSGPISIATSETLSAIAIASGYTGSSVASAAYSLVTATPAFSPARGAYTSAQQVSLSSTTPGAVIYYTLDGTVPTSASSVYSQPISIGTTTTIQAVAIAPGFVESSLEMGTFTITLPAATPQFSPAAGTYSTGQSVTITDATTGASIYYTLDGSTPNPGISSLYTAAFPISATTTVNAVAIANNYSRSSVASAIYTIASSGPSPTFSPSGGTYGAAQSVTLADTVSGASIYYTTDGSTPSTSSTLYSGPIAVSRSMTIQALATASNYSQSAVASATYTLQAAQPAFTPAAGVYQTSQTVTLTDATGGASLYYTLDGSTPTPAAATLYTGPITVNATTTINVIAVLSGYTTASASAVYVINQQQAAATPTFSPVGGTYTTSQNVTISDATSGSSIFYTLDGSTPDPATAALYTGPITVNATTTINAVATASGYNQSALASAAYVIVTPAATPTFSPAGGSYIAAQTVTITDATSGAAIYYTTDGTVPSAASSTQYTGSITVSSSMTINAIAIANNYSQSSQASASYVIMPLGAGTLIETLAGKYGSQTGSNGVAAATTALASPSAVAVDSAGNVYVSDPPVVQVVYAGYTVPGVLSAALSGVTPQIGYIYVVAGSSACTVQQVSACGSQGQAIDAKLKSPRSLALDGSGNLYIADRSLNAVYEVSTSGAISVVAGTGTAGYLGDGAASGSATLNAPEGVFVDASGNVFIADTGNSVVRVIYGGKSLSSAFGISSPVQGYIYTVTTGSTMGAPSGIFVDSVGNLFISDYQKSVVTVLYGGGSPVPPVLQAVLAGAAPVVGQLYTVAGTANAKCSNNACGDGASASSSYLNTPRDIKLDASGNLFIADGQENAVRMVTGGSVPGIIESVVGKEGQSGYSGDGGEATAATLSSPQSLAFDGQGNLYIADYSNGVVRAVKGAATVTVSVTADDQTQEYGAATPTLTASIAGFQWDGTSEWLPNVDLANLLAGANGADPAAFASMTTYLTGTPALSLSATADPYVSTINVSQGTLLAPSNITFSPFVSGTLKVTGNLPQTIAFTLQNNAVYGSGPITLNGTSSSGLQVSYTVTGPASVSGQVLTITGAGTVTVTAVQAGDGTYVAAASVSQSLVVSAAVLTVTANTTSYAYPFDTSVLVNEVASLYSVTGFVNSDTQSSALTGQPQLTTTATSTSMGGTSYPLSFVVSSTGTSGTLSAANGNYTFSFVSGTLNITGTPDFSVSASSSSITMAVGQTRSVTLTTSSLNGYSGVITLSCGTLPSYITCALSSPTISISPTNTPNLNTLSITVLKSSSSASSHGAGERLPKRYWPLTVGVLGILFAVGGATRHRKKGAILLLGVVAIVVAGLASCGGSGGSSSSVNSEAGTQTLTVTATDTSNTTHVIKVTITIQ